MNERKAQVAHSVAVVGDFVGGRGYFPKVAANKNKMKRKCYYKLYRSNCCVCVLFCYTHYSNNSSFFVFVFSLKAGPKIERL